MKISKCSKFVTARVTVSGRDGKVYTLTMFHVISSIVDGIDEVNVRRKLLCAPACRFNVDKGDVALICDYFAIFMFHSIQMVCSLFCHNNLIYVFQICVLVFT